MRLFIDNALINFQITSLQETIREAVNSNFSLFKCFNVSAVLKIGNKLEICLHCINIQGRLYFIIKLEYF